MVDILTLITLVPTVLLSSLKSDDDSFDKMNYKYTVAILVLFSAITASKQFDDDRIECWNRANFIKAYVQYTNQICYISSTYYVDKNQTIPQSIQDRRASQLNYYQWTPFIILLMALFFYLPRLIWRTLSVRSGIDLLDIVVAAADTKKMDEFADRDQVVMYIVETIDMYVDDARRQRDAEARQTSLLRKMLQLLCCMTGKFLGNYFITLYFFIKVWYTLNVVLQICLLNVFLGTNFLQFGYESVMLFRYGLNQPESKYFPRETFCDFYVREPLRGGEPLQRITVQCVLTVNLFNQQIFTVLWLWYVVVFIINISSLFIWARRIGSYNNRYEFIRSRLARVSRPDVPRLRAKFKNVQTELGDHVHRYLIQSFIMEYLEPDGFFFIRMLMSNVSDFVVQEILEQLWVKYTQKYGENDAKIAEQSYFSYRNDGRRSKSIIRTTSRLTNVHDETGSGTDAKRKFAKQFSDVGVRPSASQSTPPPATRSTSTQEHV